MPQNTWQRPARAGIAQTYSEQNPLYGERSGADPAGFVYVYGRLALSAVIAWKGLSDPLYIFRMLPAYYQEGSADIAAMMLFGKCMIAFIVCAPALKWSAELLRDKTSLLGLSIENIRAHDILRGEAAAERASLDDILAEAAEPRTSTRRRL